MRSPVVFVAAACFVSSVMAREGVAAETSRAWALSLSHESLNGGPGLQVFGVEPAPPVLAMYDARQLWSYRTTPSTQGAAELELSNYRKHSLLVQALHRGTAVRHDGSVFEDVGVFPIGATASAERPRPQMDTTPTLVPVPTGVAIGALGLGGAGMAGFVRRARQRRS